MSAAYVRVAVPVPLHQLFTYRLAPGRAARPGCRVRVPFGPRRLVGVVVEGPLGSPGDDVPVERIREVEEVLDERPVIPDDLNALSGWLARYYHTPDGEAHLLPLPPGMGGGRKGTITEHRSKTELVATLRREPQRVERLGARMSEALEWIRHQGPATASDVREATGASADTLRRLARRGLIELEEVEVPRDIFARTPLKEYPAPALTAEQAAAVEAIGAAIGGYRGFLLHGVTGSGKTEVYIRLIERALAETGRGALVLVPEIALTPQLVARFRGRLGERVAVLHSGLDPAARHEQWLRIAAGELPVVIGARSALFAPLPHPALIVVDEEHEPSFKQETAPRYHARDLALVRGSLAGAPVVLGSATPSLESWANVARGKLERVRISARVLDRPMPEVALVDMRRAPVVDPERAISQELADALEANLERGEQTILFLNRRGFAAFVICRACGEALVCESCSVTYTWHKRRRRLSCHYCDRSERLPERCPECGEEALAEIGFGTERIEDVVRGLFPVARVGRLDRDTTRGHALERVLGAFRRRETDVLIGTQMVAKGHDFPGVTLVGVLLADLGLRLPDFRATERTFQLMTQIAGRAGRAERPGRVIIQTYMPEHYALTYATTHDSEGFLTRELALREERGFPPHTHLALFRVDAPERGQGLACARELAGWARLAMHHQRLDADRIALVGPMPAPIERIKERWRFQVLLNAHSRATLRSVLDAMLASHAAASWPSAASLVLDVDPLGFL